MILLIMLLLFGQVEDTLSIRFVEESGSAVEIDGRIRHITYYDEEPGREPDTTWSEIEYVIDPENRNWVRVTEPPTWWEDHGIDVAAFIVYFSLMIIVLRWRP